MKKNLSTVFALIVFVWLCSASSAVAQNESRAASAASSLYVISAKAGGVNYVEGKVSVTRDEAKSGDLQKGDELEIGDRVVTGTGGKAEILLNPGSFARLAENSDFEFATTSLDDLRLKLNSGSAMFEVITDEEFGFVVNAPRATFYIIQSGVYRIDVLGDGAAKIEVWKGGARANGVEIKSGRQATVSGDAAVTATKFDRGEKDALELWSKARAKELVKENAQLQKTSVRNSLLSSFNRHGWNIGDTYGVWVYNRMFGRHCFLPFGYGWNSPYGYYYRRDIWQYNLPPTVYIPPTRTVTLGGGITGGGTLPSGGKGSQTNREDAPVRSVAAPPYRRIQKDIGVFPNDTRQDGYSPSYSPPVRTSPPSEQSMPARATPSQKSGDN